MVQSTDNNGTCEVTVELWVTTKEVYESLGRLLEERQMIGGYNGINGLDFFVTSQYTSLRRSSLIYPKAGLKTTGRRVDTTFCVNGLLDEVKDNGVSGNAIAHYEYIGGRVLKRTSRNGIALDLTNGTGTRYDSAGQPTQWDITGGNTYRLTWATGEMHNGGDVTIAVSGVRDIADNPLGLPASGTDSGAGIGTAPSSQVIEPSGGTLQTATFSLAWTCADDAGPTQSGVHAVSIIWSKDGGSTSTSTALGRAHPLPCPRDGGRVYTSCPGFAIVWLYSRFTRYPRKWASSAQRTSSPNRRTPRHG